MKNWCYICYSGALIALLGFCSPLRAQEHRFQVGEQLTYHVYYHLMGVWVGAGSVSFTVGQGKHLGKECFHFIGDGSTFQRYDWFYKVRDKYESFANMQDLRPYRFRRDVSEGDFYFLEECLYDYPKENIYSILKVKEKDVKIDTAQMQDGSFDVLSMIYYARNLDFASYEVGEKIPIKMFIDRKTYDLYIRFQGTKIYDHDLYGEVECYVFSPLLVEGTLFKEGEGMTVYVTKDSNVIPIYVESQIRVGSIRAELVDHTGTLKPIGE